MRNIQGADPLRESTINALKPVLESLLDLLFDVGITVREFNLLARRAAVHIAIKRLRIDGGQDSKSRVAIITGLPRSEVAKIINSSDSLTTTKDVQQPARRILTSWFNDPRFLDSSGQPAAIPIFGKRRSFEFLVSKYGTGIPLRAMLDELIQIGAIERLPQQRIRAKARVPISVGLTANAIEAAGARCSDLLGTLIKNIRRSDQPLFEATSMILDANPELMPLVRREIAEQGANFINASNSLLRRAHSRSKKPVKKDESRYRAGVTVFYFEESEVGESRKPVRTRRENLRRITR